MIRHRRKMLPILLRIKVGFRKRIKLYGAPYADRERKYVRDTAASVFGGLLRPIIRERAKKTIKNFLQETARKSVMLARCQRFMQRMVVV